ncbi:response regulator [Paenibacillus sp. JDR-2]|uniref:response regulator n=1 Tax=Paenibacillus sp. (strain JDR-2) TaxID=324057 RepID=UPI0001664747|nr:response regulator [Paenibacillus sp. JDR-2]ACT03679.1 two component transcriptional regulator, AraC family [Paenibacillus sp. JDR-2]
MYKLLIVDDETTVRMGLQSYFNWSSFGIEIMGEADDGDVAFEMIGREAPDLVLTDVRMPNMDGITLARLINEHYPHVKIIFVSGHDDADYLKSAMKLSAVDYIFKPVNLEELSSVLRHVVSDLDEQRAEQQRKEELQVRLKEGMPVLREKFLLSLMGSGVQRQDIRERVQFLELSLPEEASYWVIVISVDDLPEVMSTRSERDRQLLWYSINNICQELIDSHMGGYVFEYQTGEFAGILRRGAESEVSGDAAEGLLELTSRIRDNLERWLKISVTIGISDRVTGLGNLGNCYKQAREAVNHKWYLGKNRIITMDSLESSEQASLSAGRYEFVYDEELTSALKAANPEKLREVLDAIFADLNRNRPDGLKYGRNVCMQIFLAAGQLLLELNMQSEELESAEAAVWESLLDRETLGEMRLILEAYLLAACERIGEKRTGKVANLVERVRAIIDRDYSNGSLTVTDIGREVFLTPTYVSLLYKQETGQTVGEYMTQVRMEKAKEMLRDPQYKFYDICYAIGYTDPSYFTKLFKKMTGVTPSGYREKYV